MKNLSNNYSKMFFALLIVTSFLGVTGLNANNVNPSVSASNNNLSDCPTCATESTYTEDIDEIENWMTNENYWGSFNITETLEHESADDVENWMTNENYWGSINVTETPEHESADDVENWMVSNDFWGTINVSEVLDLDRQNNVENWMSSNSYWKADNSEITADEFLTENPLNVE